MANTSEHADDGLDETDVKHGLCQLDVTKVARAVPVRHSIRCAHTAALHARKAKVTEAALFRFAFFIGLAAVDLSNRVFPLLTSIVASETHGGRGASLARIVSTTICRNKQQVLYTTSQETCSYAYKASSPLP